MIIQTNDQNQYNQKAWRIRNQVSTVLTKWGLLPRFTRWRLTQDPGTGMIVLFGILNKRYIAKHTSIPFNDYFNPRLLHDLRSELQIQVLSCSSDGLRYAFILDRGSLGRLPTSTDFPYLDGDKLLPAKLEPQILSIPITAPDILDNQASVRQGVGAFLKVFDDIQLKDDAAALHVPDQNLPSRAVMDKVAFNERVAEHETNQQRITHIKYLFGKMPE